MTDAPKRLRDIRESNRDMPMLDPRKIVIEEGHNPRDYTLPENREHLDKLKASIREHGTRSPLWVRWNTATGEAILVDGECRLRANLELIAEGVEIASVPTMQVQGGDEASRLVLALTANTGKPLSKWEDGAAFNRLFHFGWSEAKISEKTGQKERYVREAMELANAPKAVKEMLSAGTITPAIALKEVREKGDGAGESLAKKVETAKATAKPAKDGEAPGKVRVKRERKAKGFTLTEAEAVIVRDSLAWSLETLHGYGHAPESKFSAGLKALALFPAEMKSPPTAPEDSGTEELPLVVDGTKS